jgi:hypothetical protein
MPVPIEEAECRKHGVEVKVDHAWHAFVKLAPDRIKIEWYRLQALKGLVLQQAQNQLVSGASDVCAWQARGVVDEIDGLSELADMHKR